MYCHVLLRSSIVPLVQVSTSYYIWNLICQLEGEYTPPYTLTVLQRSCTLKGLKEVCFLKTVPTAYKNKKPRVFKKEN